MADLLDQSEEVQDALGRNYNTPEIDDDELAAELDALGDEIALDDDTSYLDDVVKAPEAPSKDPGGLADPSKNKVIRKNKNMQYKLKYYFFRMASLWTNMGCPKFPATTNSAFIYLYYTLITI